MQNIWQHIYAAFIEADRWKLYLKGLGVTLEVSFFAALLGILIGTIAAFLKLSTRKNGSKTIASRIASAYIDIIRGTPTTVQLLIMWSGILATCKNSVLIASLTFGINSGAYVAESRHPGCGQGTNGSGQITGTEQIPDDAIHYHSAGIQEHPAASGQ